MLRRIVVVSFCAAAGLVSTGTVVASPSAPDTESLELRTCAGPCMVLLHVGGTGTGRVTSEPAAIDCRVDCRSPMEPFTAMRLTATADPGSWVSGWSGCETSTATTCSFTTPFGDHFVTAIFDIVGGPVTPPTETAPSPQPPPGPAPVTPLGRCTIVGTAGADVLVGTPRRDVICGLGGPDHVHALAGDDVVYGGPGRDEIDGGRGGDRLEGGPGRDVITGGAGRDDIRVKDGVRDTVNGGAGRDTARVDRRDRVRAVEKRLF